MEAEIIDAEGRVTGGVVHKKYVMYRVIRTSDNPSARVNTQNHDTHPKLSEKYLLALESERIEIVSHM